MKQCPRLFKCFEIVYAQDDKLVQLLCVGAEYFCESFIAIEVLKTNFLKLQMFFFRVKLNTSIKLKFRRKVL